MERESTGPRTLRIAGVPGDGIGAEVVPEGLRALDRLAAGRCACARDDVPAGALPLANVAARRRPAPRWPAAAPRPAQTPSGETPSPNGERAERADTSRG